MSLNIWEDTSDVWMYHMYRGEFEEAWKFSDTVLKSRAGKPCWHLPRHFQYIWDGSSLAGKRVLVRCYHGLGDTLMFIRYAPLIKAMAKEVIVWVQPPLIPLLQTMQGIDQLLPLHDGTPEATFDVDIEVMELPHIFRTTLTTIPAKIPYLHAEPHPLLIDKKQLTVGLAWKVGDWDEHRSIPFSSLLPLASVPGIQFYMLQFNATKAGWQNEFGIYPRDLSLYDYARMIKGLDLLITVDSMPAHLAGALGVPVWTLLSADVNWRWMINRNDSPWYPTMRLFRQERSDEWAPVIEQVVAELKNLAR